MIKLKYFFVLFFSFVAFEAYSQVTYYISCEGSDSNPGTINSPFKTIERAIERSRNDTEAILVLRKGTYRLSNPIVLTNQDGNKDKKLVIRSFSNEKVTISSGKILNLKWKNFRNGIMKAKVSDNLVMDMLIIDGNIRHMARFPNFDDNALRFNGTSSEAMSPERIKKWKNPETGYLHAMHINDWGDFHYMIKGKDKDGKLIIEGGWQNNRKSGIHPENRMVENIFEELDAPGEWFFDSRDNMLYYYPIEGEELENTLIETPQLKHLIEFRGSLNNPISNIEIRDINFTQTVRTFMEEYEPLLRSDWTIYRGGAVVFEGTERCAIRNCNLYNLGGNGVFFSNYNKYSEISGSHLYNIGASAICVVGNSECVRSPSFEYYQSVPYNKLDIEKGPKGNDFPHDCIIRDNLIHNIGLYEKQVAGVELSMCQSIMVSHNSIYDTPRAGINISEGTWGGHVIEYNDVFDTVKETGDHGSFNSWGRDRFWSSDYDTMDSLVNIHPEIVLLDAIKTTTIRNNRFRCDRGWDIDLDDGSSNYHIYNNLCLNGGIKLREGFYRVVENNILINNSLHPHVWFRNSCDVVTRNIFMLDYQPVQVRNWGLIVDYNIFSRKSSLDNAKRNNTDMNSISCDLKFNNSDIGDFSLSDTCQAINIGGFQNFLMNEFGVVSERLRNMAKSPEIPFIVEYSSSDEILTEVWQGVTIKNLNTLGERSATGMDSERGVYVVNVNPLESLHTQLKANDVILSINNYSIDNLEDFFKALRKCADNKKVVLKVFRAQKEQFISFIIK